MDITASNQEYDIVFGDNYNVNIGPDVTPTGEDTIVVVILNPLNIEAGKKTKLALFNYSNYDAQVHITESVGISPYSALPVPGYSIAFWEITRLNANEAVLNGNSSIWTLLQ
jgi:hypothetical protein